MQKRKLYTRMMAFALAFALVLTGFGMPKVHAEEPVTPPVEQKEDGFTLAIEVKDNKVMITATVTADLADAVEKMDLTKGNDGDPSFTLTRKQGEKVLTGNFDLAKFKGLFPSDMDQAVLLKSGDVSLNGKVKKEDAKKVNEAIRASEKMTAEQMYNELLKTIKEDKEKPEYKDASAKYTKNSWEAFTKAQTVPDEAKTDLTKVQEAKAAYEAAKNGLVKVDKLKEAIEKFEKAKEYKDKYYTEDSLKAYQAQADKLDDYKALLVNGSQKDVDAAVKALEDVKLVLVDVEFIDFISRVSGKNRISTAVEISKKYFEKGKVDAVVLARADEFPDALAAASLAKAYNGPILLTKSDHLDEEVYKEIKRLDPDRVILVGGVKALSNEVKEGLKGITLFGIDRIEGENRYETSAAVARKVVEKTGYTMKAVIATGEKWPDALTASTLAVEKNSPILLVRKDSVEASVKEALKDLKIKEVFIIGGTDAIAKSVEEDLPKLATRLSGETRYETAKAVAEFAFAKSDHAFLVSGEEFADAMAIGPVAGTLKSPILLTKKAKLHKAAQDVLENGIIDHFTIIGGDARIAIFALEEEENTRDANVKLGLPITKRYNGKVPTLKEALNR